uniref:Uncharacterized protein n=1 Tax=Opuntia streptacantha TaxID=393608 RepID=A0A7C9A5Z0_OPUST
MTRNIPDVSTWTETFDIGQTKCSRGSKAQESFRYLLFHNPITEMVPSQSNMFASGLSSSLYVHRYIDSWISELTSRISKKNMFSVSEEILAVLFIHVCPPQHPPGPRQTHDQSSSFLLSSLFARPWLPYHQQP